MFGCHDALNQQWIQDDNLFESVAVNGQCLTDYQILPQGGQTEIQPCDSSNPSEAFTFTGTGSTPGRLMSGGFCVDGTCDNTGSGCAPLPLVLCESNDSNQLFVYTGENFVNQNNNLCLDLWNDVVSATDLTLA